MERRTFLGWTFPFVSAVVLGRPGVAGPASAGSPPGAPPETKRYLIVNADDLGMTDGINRGILEAHVRGVVTSASLLVRGAAAEAAARSARDHPELSVGLHVDLTSGPDASTVLTDLAAIAVEIERQLDVFTRLMGKPPTHLDSHHHVHLRLNVAHLFLEASERRAIPLRGFSAVVYLGSFYGGWPPGQLDARRVSVEALTALALGIGPGFSEIGCHPGYRAPGDDRYGPEREVELRTLTDPGMRPRIEGAGIDLVSYRDFARLQADPAGRRASSGKVGPR